MTKIGEKINRNTVDKEKLLNKLISLTIASCTCQTKTPEPEWHQEQCRYRTLHEAIMFIETEKDNNHE